MEAFTCRRTQMANTWSICRSSILYASSWESSWHVSNVCRKVKSFVWCFVFVFVFTFFFVGGNWCCKLFDTFSHLTASVVYITGLCFESTFIVKPFRSRIVNSERYLVGKNMVAKSAALDKLIAHVSAIHESWTDEATVYPAALVPVELMMKDEGFAKSFSTSVQDLCQKQTLALKQVMDLAVELRSQEKGKTKEK
jgi:hypothetical protein